MFAKTTKKLFNYLSMKKQRISWLARISALSAKHINAGFIIWTIIISIGLICYLQLMKREGFPNVESPIGSVSINYPLNDKDAIDSKVTKPVLEEIINNKQVKKATAISSPNNSNIIIEYSENANSEKENENIKESLNDKKLIPESADAKFTKISAGKFRSKYDVLLSIHSPNNDYEKLKKSSDETINTLKKDLGTDQIESIPQTVSTATPAGQATFRLGYDWFGYKENGEIKTEPSIIIGIQKPNEKDLIYFNQQLNSSLDKINNSANEYSVSVAAAEAPIVESQIEMLQKNLLEAILIVSLVCFAFISIRAGIVASLSMFATLTLSMIILYLAGITLNTITLFALILCIGLIVDDTVIMIEAIEKYQAKFKSFIDVVKFSASKVAVASLAGTLTTILGFAPLLFITGVLGDFIRILPITVIVSLLVSLLVSITFVPFFARVIEPRKKKVKSQSCNPFVCLEKNIGKSLHNIILKIDTKSKKSLAVIVATATGLAVIVFGLATLASLKFDIFPQTKNTNNLKVVFSVQSNGTIDESLEKAKEINSAISDSIDEYVDSISYYSSGNNQGGTIQIKLVALEDRKLTSQDILKKLQSKLIKVQGVEIYASQIDVGPPKDQYPFRVQINYQDKQKAAKAISELRNFLQDKQITRPNSSTARIDKTNLDTNPPVITRVNDQKIIELKAGFDSNDTSTLVNISKTQVEEYLKNPDNRYGLSIDDFKFDFGSESSNQESFKGVAYALPILIIAMYILLAIQFKGLVQPLLIFLAVPFSLPGVGVGLALTNNPISFFAVVGFFALIGISVNNTIMLVDFANQKRKEGFGPRQSMAMAIEARMRPLLVTSTTAVVALLPLVLSDPFWESLAVTLMFGLISSTVLVTTIFPYYYLGVERLRCKKLRT